MTSLTGLNPGGHDLLVKHATDFLSLQRNAWGPLIACPVVRLKTRFSLTLAAADLLAQHLQETGIWVLGRMPSGLAYAEICMADSGRPQP